MEKVQSTGVMWSDVWLQYKEDLLNEKHTVDFFYQEYACTET